MKIKYLLILATFLIAGCVSATKNLSKKQGDLYRVNVDVWNSAASYVDGANQSLRLIPINQITDQSNLALKLGTQAERLLGEPVNKIDVSKILAHDAATSKKLEEQMTKDQKLIEEKAELQKQIIVLMVKVKEEATIAEAANKKHWLKNIIGWGIGTFGLIGGIAFLVLCPTLAVPVFTAILKIIESIVGWLVAKIPTVITSITTIFKGASSTTTK